MRTFANAAARYAYSVQPDEAVQRVQWKQLDTNEIYRAVRQGAGAQAWEHAYDDDAGGVAGTSMQTLADGATVTYDVALGINAALTIGGNRALDFTGLEAGMTGTLAVTHSGSSRELTAITVDGGDNAHIPGGTSTIASLLGAGAGATDVLQWFYTGTVLYVWRAGANLFDLGA